MAEGDLLTIVAGHQAFAPAADVVADVVPVFSRSVTLTDAQIKALPTTGVEIVPAPGVGKMYVLVMGILVCDTTAGPYGNVNVDAQVGFSDVAAVGVLENPFEDVTDLLASETVRVGFIVPKQRSTTSPLGGDVVGNNTGTVDDNLEWLENFAIALRASNFASGNFTGGNAANTLKATVLYMVIDV